MFGTSRSLVTLTVKRCCSRHVKADGAGFTWLSTDVGRRHLGSAVPKTRVADESKHTVTPREETPLSSLETSSRSALPLTNEPFAKNLFLGKFDTVFL